MPQEWWILRNNEMSNRTYTRAELLRLDGFGPSTEVCRTNSNSWVEARRDPALATLFDDEGDKLPESTPPGSTGGTTINFIPRYFRLLAGLIDLAVLAVVVLLFDLVIFGVDFRPRTLFLLGFLLGGLSIPLFDSGLIDSGTPGKEWLGLSVVHIGENPFPLLTAFGRYLTAFGPILLLGVAFDPSLPHDPVTRYVSLFFAAVGVGALSVNTYLFFFNNPTFRLLQDYVFDVWILPESTTVVPEAGFLRLNQLLSLSLTLFLGVGVALGGWGYFWENKTPPLVTVPGKCSPRENLSYTARDIDRNRYRTLLMNRRFEELESELTALFDAYRSGETNDAGLERAMSVFAVMDREVGRRINQWVIRDPQSPYALLARAKFHLREARVLDRLVGNDSSRVGLEAALEQTRISAGKALNLNDEIPTTYGVLVELNQLEGRHEKNQAILTRSLRLEPPPVSVWRKALLTDRSTVRGSRALFRDRLRTLSDTIGHSESLNLFCGLPAQALADKYQKRGDYETARKYYNQALTYGEAPWTLLRRGLNAFRAGSGRLAERDFSRAVANLPNQTDGLLVRARIHFKQDAYTEALETLSLVLEREPHHPRALYLHARVLTQIGENDRALEQLRSARSIFPDWAAAKQLQKRIALRNDE